MHLELEFEKEKDTPGTSKYVHETDSGRNLAFYIPKDLMGGESGPSKIKITVDSD